MLVAAFLKTLFSTMTTRVDTTIDARFTVANYPVPIGGVVEVYSVGRSAPAHLRIHEVQSVGWRDVVVKVVNDDVPVEEYEWHFAMKIRLSLSDVVLPWYYICFHPYGWYVAYFGFLGGNFGLNFSIVFL